MPLIQGKSKKAMSDNIETEMQQGKPQKQSIAIAYSVAQKNKRKKMADGGSVSKGFKGMKLNSSGLPIGDEDYHNAAESKVSPSTPIDPSPTPRESAPTVGAGINYPGAKKSVMKAQGGYIDRESQLDEPSLDNAVTEEEFAMIKNYRQRKAMAFGGEVDFATESRPSIDNQSRQRSQEMLDSHPTMGSKEADFGSEGMTKIDDARSSRNMNMLDSKSTKHKEELRAGSGMPDADDAETDLDEDMLKQKNQPDKYSKEGIINYAEGGSVTDHIRRKKMYAKGGMVDLQSSNGNEDLNNEDEMSYDAARKKTYYDLDQLDGQPMDSNEHGHMLSDEDENGKSMLDDQDMDPEQAQNDQSMIDSIRRKLRSKR